MWKRITTLKTSSYTMAKAEKTMEDILNDIMYNFINQGQPCTVYKLDNRKDAITQIVNTRKGENHEHHRRFKSH